MLRIGCQGGCNSCDEFYIQTEIALQATDLLETMMSRFEYTLKMVVVKKVMHEMAVYVKLTQVLVARNIRRRIKVNKWLSTASR